MPADQLMAPAESVAGNGWIQLTIEFADRGAAEHIVAEQLRPALPDQSRWWFVRKHPTWRLRLLSPEPDRLPRALATPTVQDWYRCIYEPEILAFGGPAAMSAAHELFHHDSRAVVDLLRHVPPSRRRALTVVAVSTLLRGARLDWFEQGDVWARVADLRTPSPSGPGEPAGTRAALRRLMTADIRDGAALRVAEVPAASLEPWITAFHRTGQQLATLNGTGRLRRGLRAVLAHHVIFHWNRMGLRGTQQGLLAGRARDLVLHTGGASSARTPTDTTTPSPHERAP